MTDAFEDWAAATWVKWCNYTGVQRKGQFYYNELYFVRPDIALEVMETPADPFHSWATADAEERLAFFLGTVQGLWDKEFDRDEFDD